MSIDFPVQADPAKKLKSRVPYHATLILWNVGWTIRYHVFAVVCNVLLIGRTFNLCQTEVLNFSREKLQEVSE